MGKVFLLLLLFLTASSLLVAPWIAGLAYILNSLLQPQYIWPWIFEGVPVFKITAGMAIIGFVITVGRERKTLEIYKDKQNLFILIMWVWMQLSYIMSPFKGASVSIPPEIVLDTITSIVIMYFVLLPLCKSDKALKYLCYTFIFVALYYVYWANEIYLSQQWHMFVNNRLVGPGGSPYMDGNALSTLIAMCLPFLIFQFFRSKKIINRLMVIMTVPLAWHALILFSSRGALLATAVSLIITAFLIRSKTFNVMLGVAFTLFLGYQGSVLLERTTSTIEAAQIRADAPLNPRLVSWEVGLKLIPIYPIFGAGVQMFEAAASAHFPGMTPHVAHNTFLNFSANTGLLTGILYLSLIYLSWKRLMIGRNSGLGFDNLYYYALMSSSVGIATFFICSMFLDLIIFEPLYIIMLINLIAYRGIAPVLNKDAKTMLVKGSLRR